LRKVGADQQVVTFAEQATQQVQLDSASAVAEVLEALRQVDATHALATLLWRGPAEAVSLANVEDVANLLYELLRSGADQAVSVLAERAGQQAPVDDPFGLTELVAALREARATQALTALADRAVRQTPFDAWGVAWLAELLHRAGADAAIAVLRNRDPARNAALDHPRGVLQLLRWLQQSDDKQAISALADRAAHHVPLRDPQSLAWLLETLWEMSENDTVSTLATRVQRITLINESEVDAEEAAELVSTLWNIGQRQAADLLGQRAFNVGMFEEVLGIPTVIPKELVFIVGGVGSGVRAGR
jgi:hypothetical protein